MNLNGILIVNKEKGYTSHDVAAKLRRILNTRKTGHTGTLDPQARGVLPIGVGLGTKLCDMLSGGDKEYEASLILGITTDTEDMTGRILSDCIPGLSREDIITAIMEYKGEYDQIPPMYSAIKVKGKKLYELARQGEVIERKPRPVNIKELEILHMDKDEAGHDIVKFRVLCSKGTYIRTLCRDIGEKAGCGGAMASLLRTKAAGYSIREAHLLSEIESYAKEGRAHELITPIDKVLSYLPEIHVNSEGQLLLRNGNRLLFKHIKGKSGWDNKEQTRVYGEDGGFYGVYEFDALKGQFKPYKMFIPD